MSNRKNSQHESRTDPARDRLSRANVARLSLYLRTLEEFRRQGADTVSSRQLATALGVTSAQVRKDLACLGGLGQPGIGYGVEQLVAAIRRKLGINRQWSVVLIGVGNLARALLRYQGFQEQGFRFVALFDADPGKVGQRIEGLTVHSSNQLPAVIKATEAELAMLTVPAEQAQEVADDLAAAGISGILNFAPTVLRLPPTVSLVSVDLAVQLEQLAFLVQLARKQNCTTR